MQDEPLLADERLDAYAVSIELLADAHQRVVQMLSRMCRRPVPSFASRQAA
jgi:hypothetical protein